jgi:putative flippase GtrA
LQDAWTALRSRATALWPEAAKFGIVGLSALVVDVGAFNLLRFVSLQPGSPGEGLFYDRPLTAKAISAILATTFAYGANRWWTFRDRGGTSVGREYLLFFLLNGIASGIAVGCLGVTHYLLQWTSPTADNISANVLGLALGTMFRWWSYRKWVFPQTSTPARGIVPEPV